MGLEWAGRGVIWGELGMEGGDLPGDWGGMSHLN